MASSAGMLREEIVACGDSQIEVDNMVFANGLKYDETVRITIPPQGFDKGADMAQRDGGSARSNANIMREKLDEKEYAMYVQFINSIYDALLVVDCGGRILDGNGRACEFFRCDIDELCAFNIFEVFHGFDAPMLDRIRGNMGKGSRFVLLEAYCCRRDGTIFPGEIATSKLVLGGEEMMCFFARDITRRKQDEKTLRAAQERLAQAERMEATGRVAGQIAHDFNNLLTPLLCYPSLIKEKLPPDSEARKDLDMIADTAQRMVDINRQLLMVSSRGHAEYKSLDLNAVVRSLMELMRRDSKDHIEVKMDLADDLFRVRGAEEQLLRVVQNLYQNAIDAMGDAGTFTIKTQNAHIEKQPDDAESLETGDYVKMIVSDTGHGIPEGIRNRIYEPFFTTRHSGSKRQGSGLGMSVVYGVVKDHGGRVELKSEVGRGTTFTILLPAERQQMIEQAAQHAGRRKRDDQRR